MPSWEWAMLLLKATWALFCFAYGACLGSLINVIVYRMPRGMSIVSPPSRCPSCQHRLTWRENIPVLGWLLLRGKCRFCSSRISPEYPIVEAFTGALFMLFYLVCYALPPGWTLLGVDIGSIRPDWFRAPAETTWPTFVLWLALLGSLVAVTLVDAKTSTIPLALVWIPAVLGLVIHTAHAAWLGTRPVSVVAFSGGWNWAIPHPGPVSWGWIGVALGGMIGLGISNVLLATGLITRSFADYDAWERHARAAAAQTAQPAADAATTESSSTPTEASRPEDMWVQYPHARREMVKELAFLCMPVLLAIAGWYLARHWAGAGEVVSPLGFESARESAPLWLQVLAGVCLGYLVGGGLVWLVRVFGSLAFGKEAMGLGDVYLMAAVGACLGWIDTTLAFFAAAFVGVAWAILAAVMRGKVRQAMPYGPFLAVATVLVMLSKPAIEAGLGRLLGRAINLP